MYIACKHITTHTRATWNRRQLRPPPRWCWHTLVDSKVYSMFPIQLQSNISIRNEVFGLQNKHLSILHAAQNVPFIIISHRKGDQICKITINKKIQFILNDANQSYRFWTQLAISLPLQPHNPSRVFSYHWPVAHFKISRKKKHKIIIVFLNAYTFSIINSQFKIIFASLKMSYHALGKRKEGSVPVTNIPKYIALLVHYIMHAHKRCGKRECCGSMHNVRLSSIQ